MSKGGYKVQSLWEKIKDLYVGEGKIAVFWLGQAGFVFKDHNGTLIAIDPYLTHCCERLHGFKRLMPSLISPEEFVPDIFICTHHHADHLDIDAVPIIMESSDTILLGSQTSITMCEEMGIDENRLISLHEGDKKTIKGIKVTAVYADHGELAPDAIGILMEISKAKIYYTSDTAYSPEKMKEAIDFNPDIIILPINGQFGNLNPDEAAKLVVDTKARVAIPCHYWTFKEHNGDPQAFQIALKKYASNAQLVFITQGDYFMYEGFHT
jgi:L-ascorbate 6-phosphate lactonase